MFVYLLCSEILSSISCVQHCSKKYDMYSVLIDYTGDSCELLRDHCLDNICENDGQCKRIPGGFSCSCKDGMYYSNILLIL